ncbi:ABC transporter permease [Amycolatopsis sp.]|jgi:ABC-2 type transport system permease protein|uniref:ABC transporter permease n=1 Tax=Amycolatopsis sp. TaxID=37632 RepID=UPI002E09C0B2|nr:ABC transporter permease [Amycolatopsis sp.]
MNALAKITTTELKLYLRTPAWMLLGVLFPAALLLAVGMIPGMDKPYEGGARFIDAWAPSLIVMSITLLGLQAIPVYLASYREKGVLRRLATTPVSPANILIAQLAINLAIAVVGTGLLLVIGAAVFDIPGPRDPLGFLLAFVLGTGSVFGLGLLTAALARTSRSAGGLAMIAYLPIMFFGGVYLPRQFLPDVVQQIGKFTPPGVQALQDAWTGAGPQPLQLAVLALFTVGIGALAARTFRWE